MATLAIPIILHLFHFRRFKKVYFTNVRFLKEVKEDTSARSKLRNLLVLLMRLLAIAFLVLAFAQPFISRDTEVTQGQKAVSIFIDNSFSMDALSRDVALLDKAKQRAREIVAAYEVEDRFQILTMDFFGRHQRLVNQEEAIGLIEAIETTPAVRRISEILNRQKQVLGRENVDSRIAYVISDFQRSITDIANYRDTTLEVNFIPLQTVQERNISIDSAWFDAPVQMVNQTNPLLVRVRNHSDETAENIRLSVRYDGQSKPVGTLVIPARSTVVDTVNITVLRTGWHEVELSITDFPVQFDDTYRCAFDVAQQINVLSIQDPENRNPYLEAAFSGASFFNLLSRSGQNLDYAQLPGFQLIILNDLLTISSGLAFELKQYVENGGNLIVFPNRRADPAAYRAFLAAFPANEYLNFEQQERTVGTVNTQEFVFRDVFENQGANLKLPVSQGNFRLTGFNDRAGEALLTYRDGMDFLLKHQIGNGNLYLCAAPLDEAWNNLVRNGEIFIPMLYKMAISSGMEPKIAYTIGKDDLLEADHQTNTADFVYKIGGGGGEFIPEQRLIGRKVLIRVNDQVREAGYYDLYLNEGEPLKKYAFNYDRTESNLDYYNPSDLQALAGELVNVLEVQENTVLTARIEERSKGVVLWRWCLIAALLFLAMEVLLLRFWKV